MMKITLEHTDSGLTKDLYNTGISVIIKQQQETSEILLIDGFYSKQY